MMNGRLYNFIRQTSSVLLAFCFGFFVFYLVLVTKHPLHLESLIAPHYYNAFSLEDLNDPVVLNITEYCNSFEKKVQVECVVKEVGIFYKYNESMVDGGEIRQPIEVKHTGGVCRDYAVLYGAVFKNLGFKTDFMFTENHVFNIIYTEDMYCTIDMIDYNCYGVG